MKKYFMLLIFPTIIFAKGINISTEKEYNKDRDDSTLLQNLFSAIESKNNAFAESFFDKSNDGRLAKTNKYRIAKNINDNIKLEDINEKNKDGYNAVLIATMYNNLDMLKVLLKHGGNALSEHPILKANLLSTAIYYNATDVAKYLIDKYPKFISEKDGSSGWYPIHYAVLKENADILPLLLAKGAKIRVKDNNGYDAYTIGTKYGKGVMVKILRDFELKGR